MYMYVFMVIHLEKEAMIKCIFLVLITILLCIQHQHIIFEHKVSMLLNAACFLSSGWLLLSRLLAPDVEAVFCNIFGTSNTCEGCLSVGEGKKPESFRFSKFWL
jgi:hypothetical protein